MANLKFKRLLVISKSLKAANLFEFHPHLNLITAKDNSVGKSTVAKLLFWALGCEPEFDSTWKSLDCSVELSFSVGDNNYTSIRYKDSVSFSENGKEFEKFANITGLFAQKFADIVRFSAVLPNRKSGELEVPPPAYYFLPFYIDQKRSWSAPWNNFENLFQYERWKSTIVKYHVGLLTPTYFELETAKVYKKNAKNEMDVEIAKMSTALQVFDKYINIEANATVKLEEFDEIEEEIRGELKILSEKQERLFNDLANFEAEKVYLEGQQIISESIIADLDKDYVFAVEHVQGDELECPLCGTVHDSSIVSRASIMTDKAQAEIQLAEILESLNSVNSKLLKAAQELEELRIAIEKINKKYVDVDGGSPVLYKDLIETIAANSIKRNVVEDKRVKETDTLKITSEIADISREQKKVLTEDEQTERLHYFASTFVKNIEAMRAEGINVSAIKSPLDYNKVIKEGGAAEGARGVLAYYLTIFSMTNKYAHEVIAPLVIDTPNQHEQSKSNYAQIVDLVTNQMPVDTQVILCAMENPLIEPFKEKANIIELDSAKILLQERYQLVNDLFTTI